MEVRQIFAIFAIPILYIMIHTDNHKEHVKFRDRVYQHLIDMKRKQITSESGVDPYGNPNECFVPKSFVEGEAITPIIYEELHDTIMEMQHSEYAYKEHIMSLHVASSQCACINLFMPILLADDDEANSTLAGIHGSPEDFHMIDRNRLFRGFCFEYWGGDIVGGKGVLNDHNALTGTDADIAIAYINKSGEECLWLIEHKLTEEEFTKCGGHTSNGNRDNECCMTNNLEDIIANPDLCYYHHHCGYNYWNILKSRPEIYTQLPEQGGCPFREGINQLWRNQMLALALEDTGKYAHVTFSVVRHVDNKALHATMNAYEDMACRRVRFTRFTNHDVIRSAEQNTTQLSRWIAWYKQQYIEY